MATFFGTSHKYFVVRPFPAICTGAASNAEEGNVKVMSQRQCHLCSYFDKRNPHSECVNIKLCLALGAGRKWRRREEAEETPSSDSSQTVGP